MITVAWGQGFMAVNKLSLRVQPEDRFARTRFVYVVSLAMTDNNDIASAVVVHYISLKSHCAYSQYYQLTLTTGTSC